MKVEVKRLAGGPCSLEEFAERHGLTMEVSERSRRWVGADAGRRFYAAFKGVEIGGDGMLRSAYGEGSSPEVAIENYATKIAGHHLVLDAYKPTRTTFDAPNEFLPVPPEGKP